MLTQGLDTSGGVGFVRVRLALLARTLFSVSFGFYLFLLASLILIGGAPFPAVVKGPKVVPGVAESTARTCPPVTTDALARLSAALADRYRIDRELGRGGMATVHLAQDLRYDRAVAP